MGSRRLSTAGRVKLTVGCALMAMLLLAAILAPPLLTEAANRLTSDSGLPPSAVHLLGTNDFGQDLLARTLVATRLTLLMTLGATLIAVFGGIVLGLGIWSMGGRLRALFQRLLETAVAYPSLVLALIVAAILRPGISTTIIAIGLAGIPSFARIANNQAQHISNSDYVATAQLLGVPPTRLAIRHLLPNMAEGLLVVSTTVFGVILVEISALSFIGLGVQSPHYDFGRLLNESLEALYTNPIEALGPSVMIVCTGVAVLMIGDALAERANPRASFRTKRTSSARRDDTPSPVDAPKSGRVVDVRALTVSLPDGRSLVKGVDLQLKAGEIVGLVGESGSGKSLTAMSIAGLLPEQLQRRAERLRFDGIDMLGAPDPARLATTMGIIYQDPGTTFNPTLRMKSQLTEVLRVHLGLSFAEAISRMTAALERVGIADPAEQLKTPPYQWSGGMRQRAMIAGALAVTPKLIIADEPTTALDVTVQLEVLRQLRAVNRETEAAILFISHDIGVVQELCDRICVMRQGEIVETLTSRALRERSFSHPYTRELVSAVPVIRTGHKVASTRDTTSAPMCMRGGQSDAAE